MLTIFVEHLGTVDDLRLCILKVSLLFATHINGTGPGKKRQRRLMVSLHGARRPSQRHIALAGVGGRNTAAKGHTAGIQHLQPR